MTGVGKTHELGAFVLDADERQSLVSIRSLGRAGVRVGALERYPGVPAFSSRWCEVRGLVPNAGVDSDAFVNAVIDWVERYSPRVLISATDRSVAALRRRRAEIERHAALGLASEKALDIAVNKQRTLALATQLRIRVPRSVTLIDVADLRAATEEVGFPLVVKPTVSWIPRGSGGTRLTSTVVVNLAEAARAVEAAHQSGGSVILQEWLSGTREAISLFRARGRVWARFAQLATRMHPPLGGSSVTRVSISLPPDITPAAERLVEAADLDGYSEIEFRRDSVGQAALMEINPRLSASVEVAVRAGVDFPLLLYAWAAGGSLHTVLGYRVGVRMRWLGGDLRWLRETLRTQNRPDVEPAGKAVVHFVGDFLRPTWYDYLAISDPRPALVASVAFTRRIVGPSHGVDSAPLRSEDES
ncbi:MAG: ATP-grasp domain-containing protein [Actinomycetota bacterium]|nr:ATP-grasp domain-containing protein [Actinomycetota bacterium]